MFCKYCGTELKDGETCQCAASKDAANAPSTPAMADASATRPVSENMPQSFSEKVLLFVRNQKKSTIVIVGVIALILVMFFSSGKKNELDGTWVLSKNALAGGITLEIKNGTIVAQGNMYDYFGQMKYKYEVKSDTELVLRYDWNFSNWNWSFPCASQIPVRYSLNDAGDQLTINWSGTDFVLLDNAANKGAIGNNGAIVLQKSGPLVFYKK